MMAESAVFVTQDGELPCIRRGKSHDIVVIRKYLQVIVHRLQGEAVLQVF
jgi:hypothetical protein